MSIINVSNLSKVYRVYEKKEGFINSLRDFFNRKYFHKEAVKNLNFSIKEGEIVGFLGENGAGKTTTLKMLSGVLHPTQGEVQVLGYTPIERKKAFLRSIAFVMGNRQQLFWDLPAKDSFNYQKEIYNIPYKTFKNNLEILVELLDVQKLIDVPIRKLSLGERMKMEIINNFIYDPKIIFLDEPTIGLDLFTQKKIRQFIVNYNKEKKATILLTSHYMDDIEATCKRVILLKEGEKIYDSGINELVERYSNDKIIELTFESKPELQKIANIGKIISDEGLKVKIMISRDKSNTAIYEIMSQITDLVDISFSSIPFKQLIENLMGNNEPESFLYNLNRSRD